jgi:uncharacterized protein (TIGR03118 family)
MVFNAFNGAFELAAGQRSIFMWVTEDGTISGWNPNVNATTAVIKVDDSDEGAIYKGAAIAKAGPGPRLYVTNFTTGKVDVYNSRFKEIEVDGGFRDSQLPPNYAAFGIQNVGGNIVSPSLNGCPVQKMKTTDQEKALSISSIPTATFYSD